MKNKKNKTKIVSKKEQNKILKFYFAPAYIRILVRFLDLFFLFSLNFIFIVLILIWRVNFSFSDNWNYLFNQPFNAITLHAWRFFVAWLYIFFICFIYFVLIPRFFSFQTLFNKIFKIKILDDTNKKSKSQLLIIQLFKKDFFIIFFFIIINLLFSFVILVWKSQENSLDILLAIFQNKYDNDLSSQIFSAVFSTLFSISFFIQIIYFLSTLYFSKRVTWQDSIAQVVVVILKKPKNDQEKYSQIDTKKYKIKVNRESTINLPGSNIEL